MIHFTKQERVVLLSLVAVLALGTSLNYLFKVNPRVKNMLHIMESDALYHKMDINQASAEDFTRIPGIGPVTAKRIIRHREEIQGFQSLDELRFVKGIGPTGYQSIIKYFKPLP